MSVSAACVCVKDAKIIIIFNYFREIQITRDTFGMPKWFSFISVCVRWSSGRRGRYSGKSAIVDVADFKFLSAITIICLFDGREYWAGIALRYRAHKYFSYGPCVHFVHLQSLLSVHKWEGKQKQIEIIKRNCNYFHYFCSIRWVVWWWWRWRRKRRWGWWGSSFMRETEEDIDKGWSEVWRDKRSIARMARQ